MMMHSHMYNTLVYCTRCTGRCSLKFKALLFVMRVKPALVVENAYPRSELLGWSANITFGGRSGIMSTARLQLPYTHVFPRPTRLCGEESNVMLCSYMYNMLVQHTTCRGRCNMQIRNLVDCDTSKGSLII